MPLVIHHGTVDDAVPVTWNRELGERLKEQDKSYTYYEYPGADHNMRPQWNMVVSRDLGWFESL